MSTPPNPTFDRVILVVLDSLGIGAAEDAERFGDQRAHTLKHIGQWCHAQDRPFNLPQLSRWGIGHLTQTPGIEPPSSPIAATATLTELSPGKDTTTGHWELTGTVLQDEFPAFPNGFPEALLHQWCRENELPGWLANKPASGTTILDEFAEEHLRTGKPIVYTSADSVIQIAWSEEKFGLEKLYAICRSARTLVDPLGVGRVIARPFVGTQGGKFKRTENRRDFSVPPPQPNLLDILRERELFVAGIGKIEDIFAHRSVNIVQHTGRNETTLAATSAVLEQTQGQRGLIFANLIDFDQLHGHRRNPFTYAQALMEFDRYLPKLEKACGPRDLLVLTADHGNDPTHPGTDHTRENVPLLFWSPNDSFRPTECGVCPGFTHVARLCLEALGLAADLPRLPDAARARSLAEATGIL